ncbi:MAG: hypothetical protein JXJ19_09985 [Elusimicrobia bacterium]|nr:hypothetical protein [Elusimicrobiota bacterium]
MEFRINYIFLILIALTLQVRVLYAGAPSTPTFDYPVSGETFYNGSPWISFKAVSAVGNINNVQIQIGTTAGGSDIADYTLSTYPLTFYPMPAGSGVSIKHHVQAAISSGTRYIRVRVMGDNPGTGADPRAWSNWSSNIQMVISALPGSDVSAGELIRDDHFIDLRSQIDSVRKFYAIAAYSYTNTPAVGNLIKIEDITEMGTALTSPFNATTGSNPAWSGSSLSGGDLIRIGHINDLRAIISDWDD